MSCHAGQGNLFAKPLDADTAAEVLKTGLVPRPERESEPIPPRRRDAIDVPQLFARGRRLVTANAASLAVAALALSMAGVLAIAKSVDSAVRSPAAPAADVTQQSIATAPTAPVGAAPIAGVPVARVPAAAAPAAPLPPPSVAAKKTAAEDDASPVPAKRPSAAAQSASLEVVHLHRFGDCRGRLDVSRDGVAFVSDEKDDAFTFRFAEFLHAVSDDTLTLRSAAKTYRFKAVGAGSGTGALREFADRISRARR